jgi:hypothetical protein
MSSLSNFEGSNLSLAMENISTQSLGRDASRPVKVMLWADRPPQGRLSGTATAEGQPIVVLGQQGAGDAHHIWPHQMWFASALDGAEHSLDYPGYTLDVPLLPTNQLTHLQGRFQLKEAPPYAGAARP